MCTSPPVPSIRETSSAFRDHLPSPNSPAPPLRANLSKFARVAELADALASGASARKGVGVQVPPRARERNRAGQREIVGRLCAFTPPRGAAPTRDMRVKSGGIAAGHRHACRRGGETSVWMPVVRHGRKARPFRMTIGGRALHPRGAGSPAERTGGGSSALCSPSSVSTTSSKTSSSDPRTRQSQWCAT